MQRNFALTARRRGAIGAAIVASVAGSAAAQDLFVFDIMENGGPLGFSISGSDLPSLIESLADQENEFAAFDGLAFTASIDYGGITDAIQITFDPNGGAMGGGLLIIDQLAGFGGPIVFDEANGDLGDQLEDFFLGDNPEAVTKFLEFIARNSRIAITDGNPQASTARSANVRFNRYGIGRSLTFTPFSLSRQFPNSELNVPTSGSARIEGDAAVDNLSGGLSPLSDGGRRFGGRRILTRVDVNYETYEADGFEGSSVTVAPSWELVITNGISLSLSTYFAYQNVADANIYHGGVSLDLPIRILEPQPGSNGGFFVEVTPGFGAAGSGSFELAAGGSFWTFGATARGGYTFGWLTLEGAAQYTTHESIEITVDDVTFDPGISQQIVKVGGKAVITLDRFSIEGGVTYTEFLEQAAVDNYVTPFVLASASFGNGLAFQAGFSGDFSDDYQSTSIVANFHLPY